MLGWPDDRIADSTQTKQALAIVAVQGFLDEIICELAEGSRFEFCDFGVLEPSAKRPEMAPFRAVSPV